MRISGGLILATMCVALGCPASKDRPGLAGDAGERSDSGMTGGDSGGVTCGHFGDMKNLDDVCWAPPQHYCSGGAGQAFTWACSPDGAKCCYRPNTCQPCGWKECLPQCGYRGWEDGGAVDIDGGADACLVQGAGCPATLSGLEVRAAAAHADCEAVEQPFCK
jgi:hypothetical protein